MKRMPFERPTEHYAEGIAHVDEQICALLRQRKELSDNNPGFPPLQYISGWAEKYGFDEDFLQAVFGTFYNEAVFKPMVEPLNFKKHIPVLKAVEDGEFFYTLNSVRQYSNASVVTFTIDWDIMSEIEPGSRQYGYFALDLGRGYDCRMTNGGSTSGHASFHYVISPPLPDDVSGTGFIFRECSGSNQNNETGKKVVFQL